MADWRCAAWCDACTTATYAFERVRVVDGLLAVVLWEGAHQRLVAGVRVVVIEQLPVQQRAQLLAAVALVDALRHSVGVEQPDWHVAVGERKPKGR